jgi:hypothetical protein
MTAVDILIQRYYGNEGQLTIKDLKQAQEMEKKQIIEAYTHDRIMLQITAEQYYNETFKK